MRLENSKILLEQGKCFVLQPELIKIVGRSAAILLQQIHYWPSSQGVVGIHYQEKKWTYNTYSELFKHNLLDTKIIHGDGSTTAAKKGEII
ncbi:hypothetical protein [Candidatus Paracaedibacter symbiosus]|uniref:hypothetical protein n=1 Tax=Candidatus Paracaedibacter symbiosus TaxID=244582 RepID=UPI0006923165|nr:hypothetical protein [Candidatus Paracaedibacter symbiosus]